MTATAKDAKLKEARLKRQMSLLGLAGHINALSHQYEDARFEFCKALAEARDRVKRETNMTFAAWCNANIRKSDGTIDAEAKDAG